ncbi:MAG: hypothetical protein Tsb0020_17680 [Haliangiales bacterium]
MVTELTGAAQSTILIVDDNVDLAENLAEIVEDTGVRVLLAENGLRALEQLNQEPVDLIITDMRMPDMDGIALIERLKQDGSRVPVVVMSAYSQDHVIANAHAAGVLSVLSKPIDIDKLLGLVKRVLEHGTTILLVEDNRDLRVAIGEMLLEIAQVVPLTADSAEAARRLAESLAMRMAIIDIHLPDGDGVALGREFKAGSPSLEIIYITGDTTSREDLSELLALPGVHLLQKPFSPQTLLEYVKGLL